jgi:hypothetical protein
MSTQSFPHTVKPWSQFNLQAPLLHTWPAEHGFPQPPQCFASERVSTHAPSHSALLPSHVIPDPVLEAAEDVALPLAPPPLPFDPVLLVEESVASMHCPSAEQMRSPLQSLSLLQPVLSVSALSSDEQATMAPRGVPAARARGKIRRRSAERTNMSKGLS